MSALLFCAVSALAQSAAGDNTASGASTSAESAGPVRLRQPMQAPVTAPAAPAAAPDPELARPQYVPGEFERFVQRLAGAPVQRLGADLVSGDLADAGAESVAVVPPDYVLAPGDEVLVMLWGTVDADLRLRVDRTGRIGIPRVGSIQVAGVTYGDLRGVIEARVSRVFKNFEMSVAMGQLRGVRVFVTGFVTRPGTYTVNALSTVVGALMRAGGPSAAGSFRRIELKRRGQVEARFDLYDLLLKGDRSADRLVQAGDVVHVGPVATQVGVIGSVNRPVVVEVTPGEGVVDALAMAGGFSAVADRSRVAIERLQDRMAQRVVELTLPRDDRLPLDQGDVIRAFSATEIVLSTQRQNKRVRVDGEVARPGEYVLPPESTLNDAITAAGGLTPVAYLYGTQFTRESVRATQQDSYDRALRDLETDFTRSSGSQRVTSGEQALQSQAQSAATARLIERLRALRPSGRVVLQLTRASNELPPLALEDQDRLYIPPLPTTVGVFGSVFNTGSYLFGQGRTLEDYLRLAGGPTRGADERSIFVVRANGQVISARQNDGSAWYRSSDGIGSQTAEPGDTVFVPEEMDKTTFLQAAKDWTQILYQFGIGLAGIKSAVN